MLQCVVNTVLLRRLRIFIAIEEKEKLGETKQRVIVIFLSSFLKNVSLIFRICTLSLRDFYFRHCAIEISKKKNERALNIWTNVNL